MKVAVVDVQRAVMQTEDGLRAQATLKKLFDSRQQELNKRSRSWQAERRHRQAGQSALAGSPQKKVDDWQKQMVELQGTFVEYNKELEKKQKELTDPIFERVLGAIKRIAGQESFDLIVDRATVAFSRSDLDLTDRVIQLANGSNGGARARRTGGGGPGRRHQRRVAQPSRDVGRSPPAPGRFARRAGGRHGGRVVAGGSGRREPWPRSMLLRGGGFRPALVASLRAARRGPRSSEARRCSSTRGRARCGAAPAAWVHDHAKWAMAALLDEVRRRGRRPSWGADCTIAPTAVLGPRVVLGDRVVIGPGCVIGLLRLRVGDGPKRFGSPVPQLAASSSRTTSAIGPLCTIDAGRSRPRASAGGEARRPRSCRPQRRHRRGHHRRGAVWLRGLGEAGARGARSAARSGIADHVVVGDGARIAAKSGVIGDVPAGASWQDIPPCRACAGSAHSPSCTLSAGAASESSDTSIEIDRILQILPHRWPFVLVDRVTHVVPGERIVGHKCVTMGEPWFQGHFPSRPIMPGVLIVEALAQIGGILAYATEPFDASSSLMYFLGIDKAKFRRTVTPGDRLSISRCPSSITARTSGSSGARRPSTGRCARAPSSRERRRSREVDAMKLRVHADGDRRSASRARPDVDVGPYAVVEAGVISGKGASSRARRRPRTHHAGARQRRASVRRRRRRAASQAPRTAGPARAANRSGQRVSRARDGARRHRGAAPRVVGSNNLFMVGAHVAHDAQSGPTCVLANAVPARRSRRGRGLGHVRRTERRRAARSGRRECLRRRGRLRARRAPIRGRAGRSGARSRRQRRGTAPARGRRGEHCRPAASRAKTLAVGFDASARVARFGSGSRPVRRASRRGPSPILGALSVAQQQ
jgi:beta-hydroxyacyl-ACP dehydratase FabZ